MSPIRITIVGDTHGSARDVERAIDYARDNKSDRIFVVGDFGLWWDFEGVAFIDRINEYARSKNVHIFALPGNHENMEWWNATLQVAPKSKGFAYLRTHVLLSPRIHKWTWGGKQFAVAGGAISIDREYRLGIERGWDMWNGRQCTPRRVYSPDEALTDAEVETVEGWDLDKVDYLLTHDCSNSTPFRGRFKPDFESEQNRLRIDRVLKALKPRMHFHGHMHTQYEWENLVADDTYTSTYGLECNGDYWAIGVLDTDTDTFHWQGDEEESLLDAENYVQS